MRGLILFGPELVGGLRRSAVGEGVEGILEDVGGDGGFVHHGFAAFAAMTLGGLYGVARGRIEPCAGRDR